MVINRKCMNTWRKPVHVKQHDGVYVTERRRTSSTVPSGQTQPWTGSAHASRGEFGLEQVLRHDRGEKIREPGHWLTSGHERSVQFHTPRAQTLQTHSSQTLLHISCAWSGKTCCHAAGVLWVVATNILFEFFSLCLKKYTTCFHPVNCESVLKHNDHKSLSELFSFNVQLFCSEVTQRSHCLFGPFKKEGEWRKVDVWLWKRCSESHLKLHLQQQKAFVHLWMSVCRCTSV